METPAPEPKTGFKAFVRRVWRGGLERRVTVTREARTLVDVPLTVVVIGGILAPWLLGLGAVAAVLTGCQLAVRQPAPATESDPGVGPGSPPEDAPAS